MPKLKKAGEAPSEAHAEAHGSLEEDIRALAYQLYREGGYQDGHHVGHWLKAEHQVLSRKKPKLRKVA